MDVVKEVTTFVNKTKEIPAVLRFAKNDQTFQRELKEIKAARLELAERGTEAARGLVDRYIASKNAVDIKVDDLQKRLADYQAELRRQGFGGTGA